MLERLWDFFVDTLITVFMPLICSYYTLSANVFLAVSTRNATGIEWVSDILLAPVQYLLAGREAIQQPDGSWKFVQRFDYTQLFWVKTGASLSSVVPSLIFGSTVKGLSLLTDQGRHRHTSLMAATQSEVIHPNLDQYREMGLQVGKSLEHLISQGFQRRPGDEQVLAVEKQALRDIIALLNEAEIPWWVDCGTCLGAYRYSGIIPWDCDIDVAVLLPDFDNVLHALHRLDPCKYIVQDWSSRDNPHSYIKVYIRESHSLIDIYHFAIHPETKELRYILSLETNMFFPEWWKIRERRFKAPVAFDTVFPLKKALFDGIEVFVPNDTKKYLQRYYGENLDPAKVYDLTTNRYEKDLSHPYWQRAYTK